MKEKNFFNCYAFTIYGLSILFSLNVAYSQQQYYINPGETIVLRPHGTRVTCKDLRPDIFCSCEKQGIGSGYSLFRYAAPDYNPIKILENISANYCINLKTQDPACSDNN